MADGERRRDPKAFAPVPESVDRCQREEKENVVRGFDVDDVSEAKLDVRREVRHRRRETSEHAPKRRAIVPSFCVRAECGQHSLKGTSRPSCIADELAFGCGKTALFTA